MSLTTDQYEKIIRFLDAEMEPAEMEAFKKDLDSNPEMRAQLDFEQSVRDDFSLQNITHLPGNVPAHGDIASPVKSGKIKSMRKWLAICAAAVAIIITIFILRWQKTEFTPATAIINNMDTTKKKEDRPQVIAATPAIDSIAVIDLVLLFKQYFKKDVLPENYPLFLAEALMNYESGNYITLQKLNLNNLPQTRSTNELNNKENILLLGHYYKGLAYLQTNNSKEAIINLNWVLKNKPDKALKTKTQWYLAMSYLKENNREKAVELCRSIVSNRENHILVKNAGKILDIIGR